MKTLEEYKVELMNQPSPHLRERLLGEAEASGFSAWELEELTQAVEFAWA